MKYSILTEAYEKLTSTTKRLQKTKIIADLLKDAKDDDIPTIILLLHGKIAPDYDDIKIGVAAKTALKAIATATGFKDTQIESEWKKTGDLGLAAQNLTKKKKQATLFSQNLTIHKVVDNLKKIATLEGQGSVNQKINLVAELLTSAKPEEAKYLIRTVLEEMRVGASQGTIRDAIVWAFFGTELNIEYNEEKNDIALKDEARAKYNEYSGAVQAALDVSNDAGKVALAAKKGKKAVEKISLEIGKPIKVMLGPKAKDIDDAFAIVGSPAQAEFKMDGFRMQIHKNDQEVKIFTRRLENVTNQFPDAIEAIKEATKAKTFILDAEAVGFDPKSKKYVPFQKISQRIKRKYEIDRLKKELPIEINIFDAIAWDGKNLISESFEQRRKILEKNIKQTKRKVVLSEKQLVKEKPEVEKFFKKAIDMGHEGLMLKRLDAPYKPGARVGHMVKIKETMENLDLAIVAADWGEGKRSKWLASFTLACIDEDGNYLTIGKVGTGIKEKEEEKGEFGVTFEELTNLLKPLITKETSRSIEVKPQIIVEVAFEEIQKSPSYTSGYALRFPRVIRLRSDERNEPSELSVVEDLYYQQKK